MSVDIEGIYFDFDADLRRFLRSRVSDPAAVDDVLQETYLRIHRHADSLREKDRLQSWVYQITRNALVDYYRRQRASVELPESLAMPDDSDDDNPAARELAGSTASASSAHRNAAWRLSCSRSRRSSHSAWSSAMRCGCDDRASSK